MIRQAVNDGADVIVCVVGVRRFSGMGLTSTPMSSSSPSMSP